MLHRLREQHWLWLILATGLLLRLAAMLAYDHVPEGDEIAYQSMASNLVHGQGLVDHMGNRAMYNMGYPAFILAPLFGLLGENLLWVRLAHVALGGISILLCYGIAREAGANRLGRLLAAGLWALYLPAAVHVVYLQKENLLTPLMLGGLWLALQLGRRASYPRAFLCGLLFGLIALTGNAGLALAGAAGIAIILTPARLGHTLRIAATALLAALLVITPWWLRNAEVLGTPLLNTNGGFNLYLGNNPAATGMFVSIADTPRGTSWAALRQQGEVQASATLRQDALDWIAADPVRFLSLAVRKAAYFWTPPWHQGTEPGGRAETLVRGAWLAQYLLILLAAIGSLPSLGLRRHKAEQGVPNGRNITLLWIAIASYTAVHMLFYVIFRYREPIMPLACVLAGVAIEQFALRWRQQPGQQAAPA
ncbi:ArnT family glycosyltransferase [Chitinimonas naiadis]